MNWQKWWQSNFTWLGNFRGSFKKVCFQQKWPWICFFFTGRKQKETFLLLLETHCTSSAWNVILGTEGSAAADNRSQQRHKLLRFSRNTWARSVNAQTKLRELDGIRWKFWIQVKVFQKWSLYQVLGLVFRTIRQRWQKKEKRTIIFDILMYLCEKKTLWSVDVIV